MKDLDLFSTIALAIVIVGGLNMGLYGITHINLLEVICGSGLGRLVFIIVGGAAGYLGYQYYLAKFKKA